VTALGNVPPSINVAVNDTDGTKAAVVGVAGMVAGAATERTKIF
jgi:hypothetical protein